MSPAKKAASKKAATKKAPSAVLPRGKKIQTQKKTFLTGYFSAVRENVVAHQKLYTRYLIAVLLIILIGAFAFWKKDWFVVAMVNGQPITSVEFYQNLKAADGQTILDQLIRDRLITQEANRKGISVTTGDVDNKITTIEKQLGGKDSLDSALAQRNLTREDFRKQVKIQLLVEKLLADQTKVTDKEIDDYIAQNPVETKGQSRNEVKNQLQTTKLNEKFQSWYADLQKQAKVYKFI